VAYFILDFTNNEISDARDRTIITVCENLLGTARHRQIAGSESVLSHWYLPNNKGFAMVKENVEGNERIYVTKKHTN
jgi:hypothetical protein